MKTKLFRKVLRQAKHELEKLSTFGTKNDRVCRLRYPTGRGWVYDWMLGRNLDIYGNPWDEQFAIHKIARILWKRELKEYWTRKVGVKTKGEAE